MLQMNWMSGGGANITRYFSEGDYYIDKDGGTWHGKFKDLLGLPEDVTPEHLKAALNNRTPDGQKITCRNSKNPSKDGKKPRSALELTFSAPKSLSVLNALAGDDRIRSAFDKAVKMTMHEVEGSAQRRERRNNANHDVHTGNLVYATFNHKLGRPVAGVPDPQMHSHVLLMNATYDKAEGKWYALQAGQIKTDAPYYQAFFRQKLAEQIQALGYTIKTAKGDFEIDGIDQTTLEKFSNRTKEVEAAAEKYAILTPKMKAKLGGMTREKKNDNFTWEDLQSIWAGRLTPGESAQIRDTFLKSLGMGAIQVRDQSPEFTEKVMNKLAGDKTWVKERKLVAAVLRDGIGKVDHEKIHETIDRMVEAKQWMRHKRQRDKLTTKAAKLKAVEVIDMWKVGIGKHEKLGRDTYHVQAPDKPHYEALNKLYSSRDRVTSMRGNVYRKESIAKAKADLNAGEPYSDKEVWFVEEDKLRDADLPDVLKDSGEKRIVIWGGKERSHYEEDMNLEPLRLYDKAKPTKRAKDLRRQAIDRASEQERSQRAERSNEPKADRERSTG